MTSAWQTQLTNAQQGAALLASSLAQLTEYRDQTTAQIAEFLRTRGLDVDLERLKATVARPYALRRTNDPNEYELIQWLGIANQPALGWILWEDGGFRGSRVSRLMSQMGLPAWIGEEAGWAPPEHEAQVDPVTRQVTVVRGSRETFRERYGRWLGKPNDRGFTLKSADSFVGLMMQLLREGINPHVSRPLDPQHWNPDARCDVQLRDYQQSCFETFRQHGGVSMIAPTGSGKMFSGLYLVGHMRGKVLICAPTAMLVEDWRRELKEHAPEADALVMTYQAAFAHLRELRKENIIFAFFDELHRVPANTWSRLPYLRARQDMYVAGATATPYREDDRTALVMALCGPPAVVPWEPLLAQGILHKPHCEVQIVKDAEAKFARLSAILRAHPNDRIFIYCEALDIGKDLSRRLNLPFVSGEVKKNRRELVESSKHCILSIVGEMGIDFKDLRIVIEYDVRRTGRSRTASLQYMGRLTHSLLKNTQYLVLFTPDEYKKQGDRLNGIRQELGDVLVNDLTGEAKTNPQRKTTARVHPHAVKAGDEVGAALANKAVQRALEEAYAQSTERVRRARAIHRVIRLGWDSPISLAAIRLSGELKADWVSTYGAAFKAAVKADLMAAVGDGYQTNRTQIKQLIAASQRLKR